jgi:hypothetical protein
VRNNTDVLHGESPNGNDHEQPKQKELASLHSEDLLENSSKIAKKPMKKPTISIEGDTEGLESFFYSGFFSSFFQL